MFRLIGFVTGVAITAGALLIWLRPGLSHFDRIALPLPVVATPQPSTGTVVQPEAPLPPPRQVTAQDATPDTPLPPSEPPLRQHLFWSPFRSELSARGFANGIGQRSGLEIRVIRSAPMSYRLAFDYREEPQRLARSAQIETATGLDLSRWSGQ
jgi:hypothetical protein